MGPSGCWTCLPLGATGLQRRGLRAHFPASHPQWALKKPGSGELSSGGYRAWSLLSRCSLNDWAQKPCQGVGGRPCDGIEVERLRPFCFLLSILSRLMCHCFYCCLPGLGHHLLSHGNTSEAVSLFLRRARQAFCAITCDRPLAGAFLLEVLVAHLFPFCFKCHLFIETCSSHST